jgi:alkylhydroperoxidase/carboxymuconolactone decarboxylase family protein YurZ
MPQYSIHHRHDVKLSTEQEKLKEAFLETGEQFSTTWHNILVLDPRYFQAYLQLRQVPFIHGRKLSRKVQELVLLALDASVTHLFEPGIRVHTAAALKNGASKEEILETLELSSVLGVHAVNAGVPLLQEVMLEKGVSLTKGDLSERQEKLKANFERQRGYWHSSWDPVLALSPNFFEAYTNYSSVPFQHDHSALDPKTKELIFVAIDCSTTHLYREGLKLHIRNAVNHGATPEEVMEVFELAALMGAQTVMRGADVLVEETERKH